MSSEDHKRTIAITNLRYAEEFRNHAAEEADRVRESRIREIEANIDATEKLRKKFWKLLMRFQNHMDEDQPEEVARLQSHFKDAEEEISRLRRELSMITKQQDPPPRNLSPSEKEVVCWQFVYPDKRLKKEMSRSGLDETFVDLKIQLDQWTADARKEYDETSSPSSASSPSSSSPSSSSSSSAASSSRLLRPSIRLPSTPLPSSFSTSSDYVNKYVFDHLVDFKEKKVDFDFDEMLSRMTMPGMPGMAIKGMSTVDSSSEDEFDDVFAGTSCRIFFNRGVSAIDAIKQSGNVVATLRALAAGCYLDDDDDFAGASAAAAAPVDFVRGVARGGPPSMYDRRDDWEQSKRAVDAFLGNTESERQKLNALKENEETEKLVKQMNEKKEAKQDKDRKENQKQEEYVKRVIAGRKEVKAEEAEAAATKAAAAATKAAADAEKATADAAKAAAPGAADAAAAKEEKCTMMGGKRLQRRILSRRKNKSHHSRKSKSRHSRKSKSRRKRRQQSTKRNR